MNFKRINIEVIYVFKGGLKVDQHSYKEHAENYYCDSDYLTIEEYALSNNIKNIQLFKVYFKIENKRREKEKEKERLFKLFNNNNAVQLNKDKENFIIFHKCTKNNNNKFQISFFDRLGPFSDIAAATIEELINKFCDYGSFEYRNIFEIIE